jgi:hypothetical protein
MRLIRKEGIKSLNGYSTREYIPIDLAKFAFWGLMGD